MCVRLSGSLFYLFFLLSIIVVMSHLVCSVFVVVIACLYYLDLQKCHTLFTNIGPHTHIQTPTPANPAPNNPTSIAAPSSWILCFLKFLEKSGRYGSGGVFLAYLLATRRFATTLTKSV